MIVCSIVWSKIISQAYLLMKTAPGTHRPIGRWSQGGKSPMAVLSKTNDRFRIQKALAYRHNANDDIIGTEELILIFFFFFIFLIVLL